MKLIFSLLLVLFVLNSYAENFTSISKLGTNQAFQLKAECERVTNEECYDLGDLPHSVYSVTTIKVDDYKKPIHAKADTQSCLDQEDCDAKFVALVCSKNNYEKIKNYDLLQIYCTKLAGYEKKDKQVISLDSEKKAAYDLSLVQKQAEQLEESKIQIALKKIDCGKRVIAKLVVLNSVKELSTSQIATMNGTYATIKTLLETGSLETAKIAIESAVADGTIILKSDKTELVKTLESCK